MPTRTLQQQEVLYLWGLSGVLAALAAFIFFFHQAGGPQYWSTPRDDFYYYLKIAQNLAHGRGPTFNGMVPTNGYHPLYLLVIAAICGFTDSLDHILTAVWLLATAMTVVVFHLAYRILRCFSPHTPVCAAAAFFLAVASLDLFRDGMEVTLVIPFALGLVLLLVKDGAWTAWRCFAASFTAAVMVLARLDSALLVMALAVLLSFSRRVRAGVTWRKAIAVTAGMAPVAIYLAINVLHFHSLLPVSGEAKQLRLVHGFSSRAFSSAFQLTIHEHRHLAPALLAVTGLLLLPLVMHQASASRRIALAAMLFLPWQQLISLSLLSDWFIWSWYLYTLNIAACATLCLLLSATKLRSARVIVTVVIVFTSVVALAEARQMLIKRTSQDLPNVTNALRLAKFSMTHPGIYAMGDLAGAAGFFLPHPMVQTEGLVMDTAFLEKIRRQEDLISVLRQYGVRYYISSVDFKRNDPCFQAIEPIRAGPTSAHMRAVFCVPPLLEYDVSYWRTRVYDLDALPR
ncbi:MAG TPA: hypothetical protein VGY94_03785 [Acidobacteriaceae bacterium]|jgi:hypothetical protein|nr:hypothetical protein [Acidobacteriaceae bacterium]